MWKKIKTYVISVAIALGVGALAALITGGGMDLYEDIVRPSLSPPGVLFPVVWTILYILMGIGAAMVYTNNQATTPEKTRALRVYIMQLAVNFLWSIVFFNMRAFGGAFILLLLLWVLIVVMIVRFCRISPLAAYLQIPYLLWVTFAGYLNLMIYTLN